MNKPVYLVIKIDEDIDHLAVRDIRHFVHRILTRYPDRGGHGGDIVLRPDGSTLACTTVDDFSQVDITFKTVMNRAKRRNRHGSLR